MRIRDWSSDVCSSDLFVQLSDGGDYSDWCRASLAEVEANMARTSYPRKNVHFVEGKVEETVPEHTPDTIALLRLDTDWYSSTKHELHHLYPDRKSTRLNSSH